jgi:hypothetical protein
MPCPFSGQHDRSTADRSSRRSFLASAVAVGGTLGLSACLARESERTDTPQTETTAEFPSGPEDLSTLPDRQHAWNESLVHDGHGNTVLPRHQLVLLLDYTEQTPPTDEERSRVEEAFRVIERAFQRGTGGRRDAMFNEGLLFTIGYTPTYFDRFDESVPASAGLDTPESVVEALDEDTAIVDHHDAVLVLNSDYASVALAAEEALFGVIDRVNGVEATSSLDGIFERDRRRTGFVGRGQPARKLDVEEIPDSAPLSMGFKSGFKDNQAPEDKVTIDEGPFAGGTTQMVSLLQLDLERWYNIDTEGRVSQMFSPGLDEEEVGDTGDQLGGGSGITRESVERIQEDAAEHERVGHSQKLASVRDEDFDALLLRRSEGNATSEFGPALSFSSLQRTIGDFVTTRQAMNARGLDDDVDDDRHGIRGFVEVKHRATALIPPRRLRSLPTPDGQV